MSRRNMSSTASLKFVIHKNRGAPNGEKKGPILADRAESTAKTDTDFSPANLVNEKCFECFYLAHPSMLQNRLRK